MSRARSSTGRNRATSIAIRVSPCRTHRLRPRRSEWPACARTPARISTRERQAEPLVAAQQLQHSVDLPAGRHLLAALAIGPDLPVGDDARRHVEHERRPPERGAATASGFVARRRGTGARRRDDLPRPRIVRDDDPDLPRIGDPLGEVREPAHVAGATNGDTRDAVQRARATPRPSRTGDDLAESELSVDRRGRALVAARRADGTRIGLAPLDRREVPGRRMRPCDGVIGELARDERSAVHRRHAAPTPTASSSRGSAALELGGSEPRVGPSRTISQPSRLRCSTSSGSSYQRVRSPTRARVLHLSDFGSRSTRSHSVSSRSARSRSRSACETRARRGRHARTRSIRATSARAPSPRPGAPRPARVDRLGVATVDGMLEHDRGDVLHVLLVQADDLQFRQRAARRAARWGRRRRAARGVSRGTS